MGLGHSPPLASNQDRTLKRVLVTTEYPLIEWPLAKG
jgi:hypothetical protein